MPFSHGKVMFTSSCSMLQMPIHHLIYYLEMDVTLGVLKPCYSVETTNSSKFQGNTQATPTQPTTHLDQLQMHDNSSLHLQNEGTNVEKCSHSTKWSLTKEQLQGVPLTKQAILDIYSNVFTRIGKFPGAPYKFQLRPNIKPARHAPRQVPIHLQEAFHQEIKNLEHLGNFGASQRSH